jgi:hypothetical protein
MHIHLAVGIIIHHPLTIVIDHHQQHLTTPTDLLLVLMLL